MTSKDYRAFAEMFKTTFPKFAGRGQAAINENLIQQIQWNNDVQAAADLFEDDNPKFDRERFYEAANVARVLWRKRDGSSF